MTANPLGLRFRRVHPAVLALGAITLVWVLTFSILVVKKQNGFWSVDFDMGIYAQAVCIFSHPLHGLEQDLTFLTSPKF
jgi:uncharacterized membrane protein